MNYYDILNNMKKFSVVSLFSGAGGLDLGLEASGFKVSLCVENDDNCQHTIKKNRPEWKLANPPDVFKLRPSDLAKQASLTPGMLDLLAGGPPCQPFSKSGYWHSGDSLRLKDPRAKTLHAYMKIVEELLPKVILLENVEGIKFTDKDEGLSLLKKKLKEINRRNGTSYDPIVFGINTADFGVPQIRKRIFLIAARNGKKFEPPIPTHGDAVLPHLTAWDAIGDLENDYDQTLKPKGSWTKLLSSIPEGQNYQWHTLRGGGKSIFGYRCRYWSFLLKLAKNKPSWTIQAQPGPSIGPFHWKNRLLSPRELSRLQTFPDNYTMYGSYRAIQSQVGNAVPPLMGEIIGREIAVQLLNRKRIYAPLKFSIKRKSYLPEPESVTRIPKKFVPFIGNHPAHPGEGMGPGAQVRQFAKAS